MPTIALEIAASLAVVSACAVPLGRRHQNGRRRGMARRVGLMERAEERLALAKAARSSTPSRQNHLARGMNAGLHRSTRRIGVRSSIGDDGPARLRSIAVTTLLLNAAFETA